MFPSRRIRSAAKNAKYLKAAITRQLADYGDVLLRDDFEDRLRIVDPFVERGVGEASK